MPVASVRKTRLEQREETRRRVLDAAERVFVKRGFEAASVEEIAEIAGFTRGAVYSNFRDKDDLYVTVLETRMQSKVAEIEAAVRGARDWPARIAAMRAKFLDGACHDDTPVLYAELQLAAGRHPELRRKLRALFDRHVETFARLVGGEHEAPAGFRAIFLTLFAALEGIALQRLGGHVDDEMVAFALGAVFDALAVRLAPPG